MPPSANPGRPTVLLFTCAAASVDAITYLNAHVFTANMTGNTVLLGLAAGQGKPESIVNALLALGCFVVGVMLGALAVDEGDQASADVAVRRAVWIETLILACFALAAFSSRLISQRGIALLLVATSGVAMGLQSAAARRLKLPGIATTYITGTITALFAGLTHRMREKSGRHTGAVTLGLTRSMSLQAEVFLSYLVAAGICAALHLRWPSAVAVIPFFALIAADISLARLR